MWLVVTLALLVGLAGGGGLIYLVTRDSAADEGGAASVHGQDDDSSPSPSASPTPDPDVAAALVAEQLRAECQRKFAGLFDGLEEVDSRLDVGVQFSEYGPRVGDASVAYDRVRFGSLDQECVLDVGVHLENALNEYIKAQNAWNDCIQDFGCSIDAIESELQGHWRDATKEIKAARQGLNSLG